MVLMKTGFVVFLCCCAVAHAGEPLVTWLRPTTGSVQGGQRITLYGTDLPTDLFTDPSQPDRLAVTFSNQYGESIACDIHKDGCTATQIMCYTRSMRHLEKHDVKVKIDNQTIASSNLCSVDKARCQFTPNLWYTPTIDKFESQTGKAGEMTVSAHGAIYTACHNTSLICPKTKHGFQSIITRVYAPQKCDLEDANGNLYNLSLDTTNEGESLGTIMCKPTGTLVGLFNMTFMIDSYGRSRTNPELLRVFKTGEIYAQQAFTDITGFTPTKGSTEGGTSLNISVPYIEDAGPKSTYKATEVTVGGVPCTNIQVTKDKFVTCTAPVQPAPAKPYYKGGRGVLAESFTTAESLDAVYATTDAPDGAVLHFDETSICNQPINTNWIRMTGIFVAPSNGSYCPSVFATNAGKLFVDGTEFAHSQGSWQCSNKLDMTAGNEYEIVAVSEPGDCLEAKMVFYNTHLTSQMTGKAMQERQILRATSTVVNETWALDFSGASGSETSRPEEQKICLTAEPELRRIGLYGVYTKKVHALDLDALAKALNKLPFLNASETFTVEQDSSDSTCVKVTFQSNRGNIPDFTVLPDNDVTVTEIVGGVSDNQHFALGVNGVPGPLMQYNSDGTTFADTIKHGLEGLFSVQCPTMFTSGAESFEDGPSSFPTATTEIPAFCGRYSFKIGNNNIFPYNNLVTSVKIALNPWMCFAIKGLDNTNLDLRYLEIKTKNYRYQTVTFEPLVDGEWRYACIDLKSTFSNRWNDSPALFVLDRVRIRQTMSTDDVYLDSIYFGNSKTLGTTVDITLTRLGPGYPNLNYKFTIDAVTVEFDDVNSKFDVTMKPNDCGYDFSLLHLSGGNVTSESLDLVTTRLNGMSGMTLSTRRITPASQGLSGTVRLTHKGSQSPDVNITGTEAELRSVLETTTGIGKLNVFRSHTSTCANMDIYIEFTSTPGDVLPLTLFDNSVSAPPTANVEVLQNRDGHLNYHPIVGDMIFTKHPLPQIAVSVNNVPTRCALPNNDCTFTYSVSDTPTITGINIDTGNLNDVRQIQGTGFSSTTADNVVTIGGVPCNVTAATATQITCTVQDGPLGTFPVKVNVAGYGLASGDVQFSYTADLASCSPTTSTVAGGINMTCTGHGFATASEVMVGTKTCIKVSENIPTSITCTVPVHTDTTTGGSVDVSVVTNNNAMPTTVTFAYTVPNARIDAVSTDSPLTVVGGQTITVAGIDMGTTGNAYLGGVPLTVLSRTNTKVELQTPSPMPKGNDQVLWVMLGDQGAILNSAGEVPTLNVPLDVDNMYPTNGSLFGGTPMNILGQGFGDNKDFVQVNFGDIDCDVTSVTNTKIECEIGHPGIQYEITNEGTTGYGPYFAYDETSLVLMVGDSVRWSWNAPEFIESATYGVYETETLASKQYKADGINSGDKTRKGSYVHQFNKAGIYYIWSGMIDDYRDSRMQVEVVERESWKESLSVSVYDLEAQYNINSGVAASIDSTCAEVTDLPDCTPETVTDPDTSKFNFQFSSCRTPILQSVDFTPAVTGLARSGTDNTVLTYSGTGFSTKNCANRAKINNCPCIVSESTATDVICTPDSSCSYDLGVLQPLDIVIGGYGSAAWNQGSVSDHSIAFVPVINSLNPISGSKYGGTPVTINAGGFSDISEVSVTFDGISAECTFDTTLVCMSPLSTTGPVSVSVNGFDSACESDCRFSYALDQTPDVTSVNPSTLSGPATLTVTGSHLGTEVSKLSVSVGSEPCTGISFTNPETELQCNVENVGAGTNKIYLVHADKGNASSTATVNGIGRIDSLVPALGSVHGGTNVSISGYGFTDDVSVVVDGTDFCYSKYLASPTQLYCETAPHSEDTVTLKITSNNYAFPDQTYDFSNLVSPSITSVSPSSGTSGTELSLTVDNVDAGDIIKKVMIGNTECSSVSFVPPTITCTAGSETGGSHPIELLVEGLGNSNSDKEFNYDVSISSIVPEEGDVLGNQLLKLLGFGFTDDMTVTVCGNPCTFDQLESPNTYHCVTPPGTVIGDCDVVAVQGSSSSTYQKYSYTANSAPRVTAMSPERGGTGGGTPLTLTGSGFSAPVTISIDGVPCVVSGVTATSISCTTGAHTGSGVSDVIVVSGSNGDRAVWTEPLNYYYVDAWSSSATWGGEALPAAGEMIVIPYGQTVLLDTDTPVLSMLLIDGGHVVFDDKNITLRAERILINKAGSLTVGTSEEPFENEALIELYGHQRSEEMPIYGTKVLAVRNGTLDLHGRRIKNPWTLLDSTANAGENTITVQDDISDWRVGDSIAIATTGDDLSFNQNEEHIIMAISGNTITLKEALAYKHTGETDTFGDGQVPVEFRGEVLLLTRNVRVKGNENPGWDDVIEACPDGFDPAEFVTQTCFQGRFGEEIGSDQFGGHVMIHSTERDALTTKARLSYMEVAFAGQAFRLGRYPIHFHLNGNMNTSYVNGCSIHHTFNRGINIHASNNITLSYNVLFHTMGGTMFLEDGVEEHNVFDHNVIVLPKASTSLLNDDVTPAAFWITNPNNIVTNNRAAGGTHFGYWYRMHEHPDGPSYDPNIFPRNVPLGEFSNNVVHSMGWFGVWVFESYFPCANGHCDGTNAPVPAKFVNTTSWNNKKGIEFVDAGALQFMGGILVQNDEAGFEWKRVWAMEKYVPENRAMIRDTLVVGKSNLASLWTDKGTTEHGIVQPYGDGWGLHNVAFENFESSDSVALSYPFIDGTCSDGCGGYNGVSSKITFKKVTNRLRWRWSWEAVIHDEDGSLCGTNVGKMILPKWGTSLPSSCTDECVGIDSNGVPAKACPTNMAFHRIAFNNPVPSSLEGKEGSLTNDYGTSSLPYKFKRLTHMNGWMATLINNQENVIEWTNAENFVNVSYDAQINGMKPNDCVILKHSLPSEPDRLSINGGQSWIEKSDPFSCGGDNVQHGSWYYADGHAGFAVIGLPGDNRKKRSTLSAVYDDDRKISVSIEKCPFPNCVVPLPLGMEPRKEGRPSPYLLWNDPNTWEKDVNQTNVATGKGTSQSAIPQEGEDVIIPKDIWVVIKDASPATIGSLTIFGGLEVDNVTDFSYEIEAKYIVIIGGQLNVGWPDYPLTGHAHIRLSGSLNSPAFFNPNLTGYEIGSKAIASFGALGLYGKNAGTTWTTLATTANPGDTTIHVANKDDVSRWNAGDNIIITSTSFVPKETENRTIQSINKATGELVLTQALQYKHTAGTDEVNGVSVTLAAAVGLLSRTVVVEGVVNSGETFGGRVLTSMADYNGDIVTGSAEFSYVEFRNMGQNGFTEETDPRFAVAFAALGAPQPTKPSMVSYCSFSHLDSSAIGVFGTQGLTVEGNVVYGPVGNGIVTSSEDSILKRNLVSNLIWTGTYKGRRETYNFNYEACFEAFNAKNLTLKDNRAVGSERVGFHVAGEDCSIAVANSKYSNNVAHGCLHGISVSPNEDLTVSGITDCTRFSNFIAWNNVDAGIYYNNKFSVEITNNILADNSIGIYPMIHGPGALSNECSDKTVKILDNTFIGTSSASDCRLPTDVSGSYMDLSSSHRPKLAGSKKARLGLTFGQFTSGPNNFPEKPCFNIMAYNAICGKTILSGSSVANFNGESRGCSASFLLGTYPSNDDLQHYIVASNNNLDETVDQAWVAFMNPPNVGTINPADCVDMACDAMKKAMIEDTDGSLFGVAGTLIPVAERNWDSDPRFGIGDYRIPTSMLTDPVTGDKIEVDTLAPNGRGIIRNGCSMRSVQESDYYYCPGVDYNLLVIESLDSDTETRRLSPVAVNTGGYIDLINGPQDHGWCSGYTCQKRVSLFHSLVVPGEDVSVFFSSNQPDKIHFFMIAAKDLDCIVVEMYYMNPFRIDVYTDKGMANVSPKNVDNSGGVYKLLNEDGVDYKPTCSDVHGANYIDRNKRLVYFTLKGGEDIILKRADVVIVSFKVMSVEDVFGEKIIENLALMLNIALNKIRIVNIVAEESTRRRREASMELTVEIGDPPTEDAALTDAHTDSSDVTDLAAAVMDACQEGMINNELDTIGTECLEIIMAEDVYIPTPPSYLAFPQTLMSQHENVPFQTQPKIRAFDQYDIVVEHLGIAEAPWEITATIHSCTSCPANAELIGTTTVPAENGWFNFTDLGVSHKGEGYVILFEITSPASAASMNLSVESAPISVAGVPMTAGIHSMTSGDIKQGDTFSMFLDLRDSTTNVQIPDLTWRDHTAFDIQCDLVVPSRTGNLSGSLNPTFDMVTGLATFDDLSFSGYGLFYIGCHTESTPAEFNFYSVHKVFVIGNHQLNIPSEARDNVGVRYNLDFDTTLPTDTAKAQLHQATLEHFNSKYMFVVIRESEIFKGSIMITFSADGSNNNLTSALSDMCDDISDGLTIDLGSSSVTLDSYMTVNGQDYYATCGKEEEDEEGLHPAYIALIVILALLFIALVIFLIVWRCKIRPNKKTHDIRRFHVHSYPDETVNQSGNTNTPGNGGFYYIDNGRTVFLAGPTQKVQDIFYKQKTSTGISQESIAPVATLYDDTPGYLNIRKSPLPPDAELGARTYSNLTPLGN